MKKRLCSILLCLCLLISLFPVLNITASAAGDITLSVQNDSAATSAGYGNGYGPELTSGEAGSTNTSPAPGIEIYFTDPAGNKAGIVNTAAYGAWLSTAETGNCLFHASDSNARDSYGGGTSTGKMVIRKTDGSCFNFQHIQFKIVWDVTLVITGYRGNDQTGVMTYPVAGASTTPTTVDLNPSTSKPDFFQNVDKITVTGQGYGKDNSTPDGQLDSSGVVLTKSVTIGDPVVPPDAITVGSAAGGWIEENEMIFGLNHNHAKSAGNPSVVRFNGEWYAAWKEDNSGDISQIRVAKRSSSDSTWSLIDGGGDTGINRNPAKAADYPKLTVYNGNLYAVWMEWTTVNIGGGKTVLQAYVARYSGTPGSWTPVDAVDANGATALNMSDYASYDYPCVGFGALSVAADSSGLYVAWAERPSSSDGSNRLFVSKFNGSTWTAIGGTSAAVGLNKDNRSSTAGGPGVMTLALSCGGSPGTLYAAWMEGGNVYVKYYNGTSWSSLGDGLVYTSQSSNSYSSMGVAVLDNVPYVAWSEFNTSSIGQIRVKKYINGAWTSIDGGNISTGLNENPAKSGYYVSLAADANNVYLSWEESTASANQVRLMSYRPTDSWKAMDSDGIRNGGDQTGLNMDTLYPTSGAPAIGVGDGKLCAVFSEGIYPAYQIQFKEYAPSFTLPPNGDQLSNMTVSSGEIYPAFSPSVYDYTILVDKDTASASFTLSLADPDAIFVYGNQTFPSGHTFTMNDLAVGDNYTTVLLVSHKASIVKHINIRINRAVSDTQRKIGPIADTCYDDLFNSYPDEATNWIGSDEGNSVYTSVMKFDYGFLTDEITASSLNFKIASVNDTDSSADPYFNLYCSNDTSWTSASTTVPNPDKTIVANYTNDLVAESGKTFDIFDTCVKNSTAKTATFVMTGPSSGNSKNCYVSLYSMEADAANRPYLLLTTKPAGPSIQVTAASSAASTYGTTESRSFSITDSNFSTLPTSYTAEWCNADGTTNGAPSAGALVIGAVADGDATLSLTPSQTANAGTYYFKVTSGDTSTVTAYTITKAIANSSMTTFSASVSKLGKTGATVTLGALPDGASYGSPAASGTITMTDMSINGTTLTYTAPPSTAGQTGTITIPVTGATNYQDYSAVLTVTSIDKTTVSVTGISAASNLTYNGSQQSGYTGTPTVTDHPDLDNTLVYTYTSTDGAGYNSATPPTAAGAYQLTVSVPGSNETYTGSASINFTIAKAPVSFAVSGNTFDYDASVHTATVTQTANETPSVAGKFTVSYQKGTETAANSETNVGEYRIIVTLTDDNLKFSGQTDGTRSITLSDKLTINAAAYSGSITWPTASGLTYGQTLSASSLTGGKGTGSFAWKDSTTLPSVNNSGYTLVFTPTDSNYAPIEQSTPVTVAKKELTIAGAAAASRAYNGTKSITVSGGALSGVVGSDDVTLLRDGAAGMVDSADVGSDKAVTVTGYTLTGTAAGNYTLIQPTDLTASITQADGTASVTLAGWTYGGTVNSPVPVSETNGMIGVTYSYAGRNGTTYASETPPSAPGDYTVTASFPANTNYKSTHASADFSIAKKLPSITIAANQSAAYDGSAVTAGSSSADILYSYTGEASLTVKWYADNSGAKGSEIPAPTNAGTYWIGVSAAAGTNDAAVAEVSQRFTMTKADITPSVSMADYAYGATPSTPSLTGNTGSASVTYYYSTDSTKVTTEWKAMTGASLHVGTYYMKAVVAETENHYGGTSAVVSFRVSSAKFAAPAAPTISDYTVTLAEADRSKNLEYSLDGTTWISVPKLSSSGTFTLTGLKESTPYTISLRMKADYNHAASDAATANFTTPTSYSVAYNANYGTGTLPASVTQNSGSTVSVASGSGLQRTGYTFAGWNTKEDGKGTAYAPGSPISTGATLYAQWTANRYTVKFNANGGSGAMSDETFTYDSAQALTANAFTRDGYHFAGWAVSAGSPALYSDKQSVQNLASSGSVSLYALWVQNVYSVSGTVYSTDDADITLKLMRGSTQIGDTQVKPSGTAPTYSAVFSFTGVTAGTYNIVAVQGEKTITQLVVISNADQSGLSITMPTANVSSVLMVESDTPAVVVGNLDEEAATKAAAGKTITIAMSVEAAEEQQLPEIASPEAQTTQEAITEIKDKASGSKLEFMNVDVTMTVATTGGGGTTTTEKLTATNNVVALVIPYDMTGKTDIKMYRYHDTAVETFTKLASKPASDSEQDATYYLDTANGLIYAYAQKFSTYAIGYSVSNPAPGGSTGSGSGSSGVVTHAITVPTASNGSLKLSTSSAAAGTKVTITVTPDKGYTLKTLTIKDAAGNTVNYTDNGNNTDTFSMPSTAVTVTAVFSKAPADPAVTGVSSILQTVDHAKYINGYSNGTVGPERNMTRAEVAQMFYNLLLNQKVSTTVSFSDVPDSMWYAKAVNTLGSLGIITGYADGTFSPNDAITREEFCAMAVRFATKASADSAHDSATFSDVTSGMWSYDKVMTAAALGWISGYSDGSFAPQENITRAQVVTIVNHMLGRSADKHFVDSSPSIKTFSDLIKSHWAYYDLIEATNTHDYKTADGGETWSTLK